MFDIEAELKKLPDKPGVYIMKDSSRQVIYVGKALVLKNRVKSYFKSANSHSFKTQVMVSKIAEFEYIITDNEIEALMLELNLIQKYKPKYNMLLKDDKSLKYPYIKVTLNEEYPRLLVTRIYSRDGARYFGPYSKATAVRESIAIIRKLFPIKTCSKVLPRDIGKFRPCLNFYIHQCLGPCQGEVNKEAYRSMMKDVCDFLAGKHELLIEKFEKDMRLASENMEFEKAASFRDKIQSLKGISDKQKILSNNSSDQDVISYATGNGSVCVQVFFIREGKVVGREHFIMEEAVDTSGSEILSSFIIQYYGSSRFIPREIVLKEAIDRSDVLENWLSNKKNSKVYIKVPQKGEKVELIEMVSRNAVTELQLHELRHKEHHDFGSKGLAALTETLALPKIPHRIEAYDISNTGGSEIVSSMVVFIDGKPYKDDYRRFKIKSTQGPNDYLSMQETLHRRFTRLLAARNATVENEDSKAEVHSFAQMPDLVLVDGGLGHVNASLNVLFDLGIDVPVWGMVKDDRHRSYGLVSLEKDIPLSNNLILLRFITAIQDEAHRFALTYNKLLRARRNTESELDKIEGIGPKRKTALLKHFGSVAKIRNATHEELVKVNEMNSVAAEKVYAYFHK